MHDRIDWKKVPSKLEFSTILIYLVPWACFFKCGDWWKWLATIAVVAGVCLSRGLVRRFLGLAMLWVFIDYGTRHYTQTDMWALHDGPGVFWFVSVALRMQADGVQHAMTNAAKDPWR